MAVYGGVEQNSGGVAAALAGWAAGKVWYGGVRTVCSTVDN